MTGWFSARAAQCTPTRRRSFRSCRRRSRTIAGTSRASAGGSRCSRAMPTTGQRTRPKYGVAMRILNRWRELLRSQRQGAGRQAARELSRSPEAKPRGGPQHCSRRLQPLPVRGQRAAITRWPANPVVCRRRSSIFRTPQHLKRGIDLAQDQVATVPHAIVEQIPWHRVKELNRRAMMRYLTECFGQPMDFTEDGWLSSPCPRCDDGRALATPLQISNGSHDLTYVARCSHCGLADHSSSPSIPSTARKFDAGTKSSSWS